MVKLSSTKITSIIIFLLIYFMLLMFAGFYFFEYTTVEGHVIVLIIIFLLVLLGRNKLSKRKVYFFLILSANVLFTQLITGFNPIIAILTVLILFEACLLSSIIEFETFRDKYVQCLIIISIVSLLANIILLYLPNILNIFPVLTNSKGNQSVFLLFASVSDFRRTGVQRNQGIFWEPGAFQIFLCLAYFFELYRGNSNPPRKWVLLLFIITMFSTISTTGIITAVLLLTFTLVKTKKNSTVIKVGGIAIILLIIVTQILPNLEGFWQFTLVTKINQVLDYQVGVANAASSRMDALVYPFWALLSSPFWGIGTEGFKQLANIVGHSMFTCTPINWFAMYGAFYGIFIYVGLFKGIKSMTQDTLRAAVVLVIICVSLFSENLSTNIIIMIMVFYGISAGKIDSYNDTKGI